ncbi:chromosome partitioning protein ParA [Neorhizobium sp. SOG26]|uniref:nucleotide-binding protein n=1 Tax=Neorhizobium sp. SOG26 TaxID=2060726 RepID=UPI000E58594F|nr:Wzz/FepE/Etk N-terminal domain-containing protein [Neorhizobium sp. SOG26]AXV14998.1 chromosome partitioning protein ParA [Neorhizobium sp. SOG26]
MNQRHVLRSLQVNAHSEPQAPPFHLANLISVARRQWPVFGLCLIFFLALGSFYCFTAVPRFTARTSVLIDGVNSQVVEQLSSVAGVLDDEASFLGQVELLKSEAIAFAVIDGLKLQDNSEFMRGAPNPFLRVPRSLLTFFRPARPPSGPDAMRRQALEVISRDMEIARIGRSYVIEISFTANSAELAASVATAVADYYLADKLESKTSATRRAGDWLQLRIEDLRHQSLQADAAVQRFRAANGLLVANDTLLSDQKLVDISLSLNAARTETEKAQARVEAIQAVVESGAEEGVVGDALESPVINTLRQKFLEASRRHSEIVRRSGEAHAQAERLKEEMAEYKRLMFDELKRIAQSYQNDLAVATSRERQIGEGLVKATAVSLTASETQVQLRELELTAATYRNLYQTFLQRYHEAVQQQSFPVTEARVIARAMPPVTPSEPRIPLVLAVSVVLGCAAGAGAAAFREASDRGFRAGEQVRQVLGLRFLGYLSHVAPLVDSLPKPPSGKHEIRSKDPIADFATEFPLSPFAETLRNVRLAAELEIPKRGKVIGIISVVAGEGKSTVAINLAKLLAQGASTILIDADLRNPGATRTIAQHAQEGLLEVLLSGDPPSSRALKDPESGALFLPTVMKRRIPRSSELLASGHMARLLAQAAEAHDYVLLDLPPVAPIIDARAVMPHLDAFVLVVEWGKTPPKLVAEILAAEPQLKELCLGIILNKVDSRKMKLYREYGSSQYYASPHNAYHHEDPDMTVVDLRQAQE